MIDQDEFDEKMEELRVYAEHMEMHEVGETLTALLDLCNCRDYLSDSFSENLENEVISQLEYFQKNTKIEKRTETVTRTENWEELVWTNGEY
jgi:hypothetical protein